MLFKFFSFLIFLSPLVFFHELGHFLVARFFGVRVEIFSIGFGKKLFSFKRGDTDYRFSLIPLGGFVKMYGENLLEQDGIPADQREFAYNHKSKWARFWIIFAGPLANFILAFVLYFTLIAKGEKVREFKVAELTSTSKMYEAGFRTGDIIRKINGEFFYTQEDMVFLDNVTNIFEVERNKKLLPLEVSVKPEELLEDYVYNSKYLIEPVFYGEDGTKYLFSATKNYEEALLTSYQEMLPQISSTLFLFDYDKKDFVKEVNAPDKENFLEGLRELGFYRNDLFVNRVIEGNPASTAGLKSKTLLKSVNGKEILSFNDLRDVLQTGRKNSIELAVIDLKGVKYNKRISPKENVRGDKKFYTIGIESGLHIHQPQMITIAGQGFVKSVKSAYKRTYIALLKTVNVIKEMIFGSAAIWDNLGGPIAIANVASSSLSVSVEYFLRFMAIMSINLGLMNLLPIPVLDGGHILFIFFEFINRGVVSRKKMEFAQRIGLSFLLLLMGFVIYNDISRFLF